MELLHSLAPNDKLLVVSDGSSFESVSMSFGLAIGTSLGNQILTNKGPAFGQPSSHRAECTGCLAGSLVLRHLQSFTQMPFPNELQTVVISDNAAMIASLTDRATYHTVYHNATLAPDWDLLEEIHQQYETNKSLIRTYQWVRGHQDTGPTSGRLSIEAELNIQADALASEFHTMVDAQPRLQSPLMGHTRCILQITGTSIHANYPTAIRHSASEPRYSAYLTRKHQWHPRTYCNIEWRSFRMAARTYHSSEVHLLKLVHDQLPTRAHLAKFQPWTIPKCHHCDARDTIDHLQRTNCNPISARYPDDVCHAVTAYFDKHQTPQAFCTTFLYCLRQWLQGEDEIDTTAASWHGSPALHRQQQAIGWRLLPRGMLSTHWITLLRQTLHNNHWRTRHIDVSTYTGASWSKVGTQSSTSWSIVNSEEEADLNFFEPEYIVDFDLPAALQSNTGGCPTIDPTIFIAGLIKILWIELATLWRSHLDLIHDTASTAHSPVTRAEAILRIRTLHECQATVEPQLRTPKYFPPDIEQFVDKSSLQQLSNYIEQYSPVILASQVRHLVASAPPDPTPPLDDHSSVTSATSCHTAKTLGQPISPTRTRTAHDIPSSDVDSNTPTDTFNPLVRTVPALTGRSTIPSLLHPALEEAQHRKHTRRRNPRAR